MFCPLWGRGWPPGAYIPRDYNHLLAGPPEDGLALLLSCLPLPDALPPPSLGRFYSAAANKTTSIFYEHFHYKSLING